MLTKWRHRTMWRHALRVIRAMRGHTQWHGCDHGRRFERAYFRVMVDFNDPAGVRRFIALGLKRYAKASAEGAP